MSLTVERTPIDVASLPENLKKHLDPKAPPPLKMMAARGMLPVAPEQNLRILYQLSLDGADGVAEEAENSLKQLPPNILLPVLQKETHEGILDWVAARHASDEQILEAVITNNATSSNTIARLAKRASARICDVIATNQVRILQSPIILEQMYLNPNARMATVDRLVELARREGLELKGLPVLRDAMKSGQDIFGTEASEVDDEAFASLLNQEAKKVAEEEKKEDEDLTRAEREKREEEEEKETNRPLYQVINNMSISQKIRMAMCGSREAVKILVRDPNRLVHMAAIRSPRVRVPDVRAWAKDKAMPDGVISYIANNRDWMRHYDVMFALVSNPKTPVRDAMNYLNHIRTNDLKGLMRDRNISPQVKRQAKTLYNKRSRSGR